MTTEVPEQLNNEDAETMTESATNEPPTSEVWNDMWNQPPSSSASASSMSNQWHHTGWVQWPVVRPKVGKCMELGVSIGHGSIKLGSAMFGRKAIGIVGNWLDQQYQTPV